MKKILSLLLAVSLLFSVAVIAPVTVSAAENSETTEVGASSGKTGDCTWRLDDNNTLTISGSGAMEDYINEDSPWLDDSENIESIVIQNGITHIGECAFKMCINLTSVTVPNSVTSIGGYAFVGCTGLANISIPDSVTSIGYGAFDDTEWWWYTQPNDLVYVGKVAYKYKGTMPEDTSIIIKDGTKGIAGGAFYGYSDLKSVTIPNGVTNIGSWAFSYCEGLESIVIPGSVTSIGGSAFEYCTSLKSIDIPNNIKIIEDYTFVGCFGLESISIPKSVTSIGESAFSYCRVLTSVTIPDSVTTIGEDAFYDCKSLTSVEIPESVTTIGKFAFGYMGFYVEKVEGFTIYGKKGSAAEQYAKDNGFTFIDRSSAASVIGDVNGDNVVDILDATVIQKFTVEKATLTDGQKAAADVNGDNVVDILDATDIQKFTVDKIKEFKK